MLPEPGSAEDWLRHPRSDLVLARQEPGGGIIAETLCFHAQQAAEKAIKAVLVSHGLAFPKTHSIERLVDLLPLTMNRTRELETAHDLTVYATELRYPGRREPAEEDLREALRLAEAVFAWAEGTVREGKGG